MGLFWFLIVGLIAGWLAGHFMKGSGYGLIGDIVIGIIGAYIGGFLLGIIGIHTFGLIGRTISATIGACVLVWLIRLVKRA